MRRLTFTYRDGKIELVSQQQVEMRVPAKAPAPRAAAAGPPEFWYELRDAESELLYRLEAEDPIPTDVEVFSDDPERTIERAPNPPEEGVFTVLLPDFENAREVKLMRAAAPRDAKARAAKPEVVEVARFNLTEGSR